MDLDMTEKLEIRNLSVFNGTNFSNWKFRMATLLKEQGFERFLTKSVNEDEELIEMANDSAEVRAEKLKNKKKENLEKSETKCHLMLFQRINDNYLEYVKYKENPKEVWKVLHDILKRKGVSNRMFLRRKLLTFKMNENDDLAEHILEFDKIVRELKAVE